MEANDFFVCLFSLPNPTSLLTRFDLFPRLHRFDWHGIFFHGRIGAKLIKPKCTFLSLSIFSFRSFSLSLCVCVCLIHRPMTKSSNLLIDRCGVVCWMEESSDAWDVERPQAEAAYKIRCNRKSSVLLCEIVVGRAVWKYTLIIWWFVDASAATTPSLLFPLLMMMPN